MRRDHVVSVGVAALAASAGLAVAGGPTLSNTLGAPGMSGSYIAAFHAHDDGSGEKLYATGSFTVAGVPGTTNLARWNGSSWESVGGGLVNQYSNTMTSFQGDLIVGGYFDSANGVAGTAKLARWDGTQWHSMDAQSEIFLNSVWDLAVWDDGTTGEQLYVAGNYSDIGGVGGPDHIAKWDGTTYTPVGGTIGGAVPLIVLDLLVADLGDGEKLYAGGRFLTIDGVPANNIAVWDGTSWSALGDGVTPSAGFAQVLHMTAWDDGNGMALYVGGRFANAGGSPASRVAKWDGTSWSAMGAGLDADCQELVVFDDGSGEALYALGEFAHPDAGTFVLAKRWNGETWDDYLTSNDGAFGGIVYDAGEGNAMHIGGSFSSVEGVSSNRVISVLGTSGGCNAADLAEPFGVLDFSDVVAFLGAFDGMQSEADLAEPFGTFDFSDVVAFLGAFAGGCP
ncbi:MAG: GC-type dockerin domain-anchored protein [Phycisphaerales bacterium JB059]